MKRLLITLLLLVGAWPAGARSLSIVAEVDPASTLPGIPIRLVLTVKNTSDVPQTLPQRLVLQVRPPSDEPFIPENEIGFPVQMLPEEYSNVRTLKPGETRVYDLPLSTNLTSGPMADPRLWIPATYGLQLFFHDDLRDDPVNHFGLHGLLAAGRISSPLLASSEAALRIEKPTGANAEIWAVIVEKTNGRGLSRNGERESDAIARELWGRAPASPYVPYLVGYMRYVPREQIKVMWNQIVQRDPHHPIAEGIRLGAAQMKAMHAESAISRGGDLHTVLEQTDEARAEIDALQKETRHDLVRLQAQNALAKVKTRERLVELYQEIAPKR